MKQNLHPFPRDNAQAIALQALAFLASEPTRLEHFIAETGISLDELHQRAGEDTVQVAALEHLMRDEPSLLAFAANARLAPEDLLRAHAALDPAAYGG